MSFYDLMEEYKDFDFDSYLSGVSEEAVLDSIKKPKKTTRDFLNMLSPKAIKHLELMAVEGWCYNKLLDTDVSFSIKY